MVTLATGQLYVNGVLRDAAGGRTYKDVGPWTGEVVGEAADASAEDMEEAQLRGGLPPSEPGDRRRPPRL